MSRSKYKNTLYYLQVVSTCAGVDGFVIILATQDENKQLALYLADIASYVGFLLILLSLISVFIMKGKKRIVSVICLFLNIYLLLLAMVTYSFSQFTF